MKVKNYIELLEEIEFEATCEFYDYEERESIDEKFDLKNFGKSCYSGYHSGTFVFEKNGIVIATFSNIKELKTSSEVMNMEVVKISNFKVKQFYNVSQSGNEYYDNSCSIRFIVK